MRKPEEEGQADDASLLRRQVGDRQAQALPTGILGRAPRVGDLGPGFVGVEIIGRRPSGFEADTVDGYPSSDGQDPGCRLSQRRVEEVGTGPYAQERLLSRIFRRHGFTEDLAAKRQHAACMPIVDLKEGSEVPPSDLEEEIDIRSRA